MRNVGTRKLCLERTPQTTKSAQRVCPRIVDNTYLRPGRKLTGVLLLNGRQRPFEKKRVDVRSHILMAERHPTGLCWNSLGSEEGAPLSLEKTQKALPTRKNGGERPGRE